MLPQSKRHAKLAHSLYVSENNFSMHFETQALPSTTYP